MDKNQILGFTLILFIVAAWTFLTAPTAEDMERQQYLQDSIKMAQELELTQLEERNTAPILIENSAVGDSATMASTIQKYGSFGENYIGSEEVFTLDNSKMTIQFTNKGGRFNKATLKEHKKVIQDENYEETKVPLELFEDEKNRFEYLLPVQGKTVNTGDLFFKANKSGNTISFRANAGNGYIEQLYTLQPDSYILDYKLNLVNLNQELNTSSQPIKLHWKNYLDKLEVNTLFEKTYSSVYFKETEEDSDYCSCRADDLEDLNDKNVEWVSHVNQFFNTSLISKSAPFDGGIFETKMMDDDDENLKLIETTLNIPYGQSANEMMDMQFYIGPNQYEELKAFDNGLEQIIAYGRSIFGTINRVIIRPFFNFLLGFISSKGLVIILLIFIIKMLLYPLNYKMLASQAKMGALKPQLAGLKDKFKDEPQKVQMETMKVYREYGVSPFGGCLPMAMQMPIFYALFRFFPADITFRQESFLWASDLSSYDVFMRLPFEIPMFGSHLSLFTILWAITQVIYTYYNTKHMDLSANPAMKYVQYLMPIMFLVFFNNYSSGLTCYMFFSTLFTILQTIITKKFVFDEEKILKELEIKKAKPKKKGGFQERLEEAMKQQQKAQKAKENKPKKNRK